jgi:hypothetical protein
MKKITLLFILLSFSFGFSQNLLLGFEPGESGGIDGAPFGGMAAPIVEAGTGSNTTQVLKIVANSGNQIWQGINLNLTTDVDLTSTQTMAIDVKSATAITFLVKVNDGTGGEAAAAVTHNGDDTWQTLSFTFNTALDLKAAMANGIYNGFVVHAYWAPSATVFGDVTADERTFYIDNISGPASTDTCSNGVQDGDETGTDCGGSCPNACPIPPTVAAPTPPARAAADVVSIYSDAYAAIPAINLDAGWCDSNAVTATTAGGNAILAYNDRACQGIDFDANQQDISGLTHIHVDFFIQVGTDLVGKVFNLKVVGPAANGSDDTLIPIDINALSPAPVPGTWYSFDLAVSFKHQTMRQFAVTSNLNNVVWYDNLYLHKNTTLGVDDFFANAVKLHPNPAYGVVNISTPTYAALEVSVHDLLGKLVIPVQTIQSQLNISSLNPGMYFVNMKQGTNTATKKLLVN